MGEYNLKDYVPNSAYQRLSGYEVEVLIKTMLDIEKPLVVALDTETYYDPEHKFVNGKPVISRFIKGNPNNRPFGVSIYDGTEGFWITDNFEALRPLLETEHITKVGHNLANYDQHMFMNIGLEIKGKIIDTMVLAQLTDEERMVKQPDGAAPRRSRKLKDLAYHYLGADSHDLENMVDQARAEIAKEKGIVKDAVSYLEVDQRYPDVMKDYATADVEYTYKLYEIFEKEITEQNLWEAVETDVNAIRGTVDIERQGIRIDLPLAKQWDSELHGAIVAITKDIYATTGCKFNINSSKELVAEFEKVGVEWLWFTDKKEYATDSNTLKILQKEPYSGKVRHLATIVKEYRDAVKLKDTFIKGIFDYLQDHTGKVHPNFYVTSNDQGGGGTVTGRLSSANPNFQNQPKKPKVVRGKTYEIRNLFIPDEEHVFVHMDYDQQEYRLLAHYGNDNSFRQIVKDGLDIHKGTAGLMLNVPYSEVTKDQRSLGKTFNFGLVYGLGAAELAAAMGFEIDTVKVKAAQKFLYQYYKAWDLPPYKQGKVTLDMIEYYVNLLEEEREETRAAVIYYYSDTVQQALKEASDKKKLYFTQFPGINNFIKKAKDVAASRGYVMTWTKRRRHFKEPRFAYKAPNSIIQGGCGDMLKVKIHELNNFLAPYKSCMVNLIHDEIKFMVSLDELHLIPQLRAIMEDLPFTVPISAGLEWSLRWGEKNEDMAQLDSYAAGGK